MTIKILLIEDDSALATTLAEILNDYGYTVDIAEDGEVGWEKAKANDYKLALLDIMLPKLDGLSLCHRLRLHKRDLPIIMITARDTSADLITGLDSGADDYVVKPFDPQVLLARIRTLLRRTTSALPAVLDWGDLHLDLNIYSVNYGEQSLHLTPKEFGILELLLRHGHQVLRRNVIVEKVWSADKPPKEDTINANIKSLRQKLRAAGAPENLIETVHSVGYRLKQVPSTGA